MERNETKKKVGCGTQRTCKSAADNVRGLLAGPDSQHAFFTDRLRLPAEQALCRSMRTLWPRPGWWRFRMDLNEPCGRG